MYDEEKFERLKNDLEARFERAAGILNSISNRADGQDHRILMLERNADNALKELDKKLSSLEAAFKQNSKSHWNQIQVMDPRLFALEDKMRRLEEHAVDNTDLSPDEKMDMLCHIQGNIMQKLGAMLEWQEHFDISVSAIYHEVRKLFPKSTEKTDLDEQKKILEEYRRKQKTREWDPILQQSTFTNIEPRLRPDQKSLDKHFGKRCRSIKDFSND